MRNYNKGLMCIAVGLSIMTAHGQDRLELLRESNVVATEMRCVFVADGGCLITGVGTATYDGGMHAVIESESLPYNGARCGALRDAATKAVKREMKVGSGGAP